MIRLRQLKLMRFEQMEQQEQGLNAIQEADDEDNDDMSLGRRQEVRQTDLLDGLVSGRIGEESPQKPIKKKKKRPVIEKIEDPAKNE